MFGSRYHSKIEVYGQTRSETVHRGANLSHRGAWQVAGAHVSAAGVHVSSTEVHASKQGNLEAPTTPEEAHA